MNEKQAPVRTTLRIPGDWPHPSELLGRMPAGFRLTAEALILPDGTEIEFAPLPPDDQFAQIFKSSCRRPATDDEMAIVESYTVNIALSGPGGSMREALTMMQAGAAIVRAGGAGVFIDNSALAHGGANWMEMADDGGPDAVSFAFVAIVRGRQEVWSAGMQVLGLPDVVMRRADVESMAKRSSTSFVTCVAATKQSVKANCWRTSLAGGSRLRRNRVTSLTPRVPCTIPADV